MTNDTLITAAASNTDAGQGQQGATDANAGTTAATTGASTQQTDSTATDQASNGKEGEGASEGDKAQDTAKPGAPEQYEFKFDEGAQIDAEVLKEFEAFAKEKGLDQESAQAIANFGPKLAEKFAAQQFEAIEQATQKWAEETAADKELGGTNLQANMAVAKKAVDAFGSPELKALLGKHHPTENPKGTGLGNHPEILRFLYKAGKAISEDTMVTQGGAQGGASEDLASLLYPTMKK